MQDVRQTTDPPSDILMSHSNQRLDRPLTPSNFFGHTNRAQPPAGLSGQGELFSTPASKTIYASGSRSILNSSSNDFNLIDTESIRQGASIYSTPFTSQNAMMRNVASSPSPPVPPYHEPRFVDGGRSRYLDYYAPSKLMKTLLIHEKCYKSFHSN